MKRMEATSSLITSSSPSDILPHLLCWRGWRDAALVVDVEQLAEVGHVSAFN